MADANLGSEAAKSGVYISPHKTFDTSVYPNTVVKGAADVAYESTSFLFDGSDAMPAAVGAGTFWDEMVAWCGGDTSLDEALAAIEASWPQS